MKRPKPRSRNSSTSAASLVRPGLGLAEVSWAHTVGTNRARMANFRIIRCLHHMKTRWMRLGQLTALTAISEYILNIGANCGASEERRQAKCNPGGSYPRFCRKWTE